MRYLPLLRNYVDDRRVATLQTRREGAIAAGLSQIEPCSVNHDNRFSGNRFCRKPLPTQRYGLGPPSPAVQERALKLYLSKPLARIAGEAAERSEAGEGVPAPSVRFTPLVPR
jgi:hypothetical protein